MYYIDKQKGENVMSFQIKVYLRDTRDGHIGIHHCTGGDNENMDSPNDFNNWIWSEGNFACDCNRSNFLYGYHDEEKYLECNYGDNIIVIDKIIRTDTGEVVYSERDAD